MYKQTKSNQAKPFPATQQIRQICKFCGKETTNLNDLNISLSNMNVSFVVFWGHYWFKIVCIKFKHPLVWFFLVLQLRLTYCISLVNRIMYCQNIRRNIERSRPNTVTGNVKVNSALACDTTPPPPRKIPTKLNKPEEQNKQ